MYIFQGTILNWEASSVWTLTPAWNFELANWNPEVTKVKWWRCQGLNPTKPCSGLAVATNKVMTMVCGTVFSKICSNTVWLTILVIMCTVWATMQMSYISNSSKKPAGPSFKAFFTSTEGRSQGQSNLFSTVVMLTKTTFSLDIAQCYDSYSHDTWWGWLWVNNTMPQLLHNNCNSSELHNLLSKAFYK